MKNVIKLNHYFCPSELENAIYGWVKYYNERRFHESLDNLTPKYTSLGVHFCLTTYSLQMSKVST